MSKKVKNNRSKWSDKMIKYVIEQKTKSGCKFIKRIKNSNILLECQCGNEFETTISNFIDRRKRFCSECGLKKIKEYHKLNYDDVKKHLESIGSAKLLSKTYENSYSNLLFQCECGNTFETTRGTFINLNKRRCNFCSNAMSQGEISVLDFLNSKKLQFKMEYSEDKMLSKLGFLLRIDFAIFKDDKIKLAIEMDGKQHFEPVRFGGCSESQAVESHLRTIENDGIKNQYCKENNIPLLRIPYWEFNNIEEILDRELSKYETMCSEDLK